MALEWYKEYQDLSKSVKYLEKKFGLPTYTLSYVFRRFNLKSRAKGFLINNSRGKQCNDNEALRRLWFYNFAYKRRAAKKNLEFNLTGEQFLKLITSNCFYCGKSYLEETRICNGRKVRMLTVDRIDPSKGYVIDNCVPACKQCNTIKMDYTITEFLSKIKQIYNWTKKL